MGLGSTAVAAAHLGVSMTGIELMPAFYEEAIHWAEEAVLQKEDGRQFQGRFRSITAKIRGARTGLNEPSPLYA